VALSGASTLRVHSTGDVTGSASEASHVEISGGGSCAALVLSTAAVCVAR
jgi:cytoskeletal protein CcmA (bactofilin family)